MEHDMDTDSSFQRLVYRVTISVDPQFGDTVDRGTLKQLFLRYAEPIKIFYKPETLIGHADFVARSEAEACIRAYNKRPPLFLEVNFASPPTRLLMPHEMMRMREYVKVKTEELEELTEQVQMLRNKYQRVSRCMDLQMMPATNKFGGSRKNLAVECDDELFVADIDGQINEDVYETSTYRNYCETYLTAWLLKFGDGQEVTQSESKTEHMSPDSDRLSRSTQKGRDYSTHRNRSRGRSTGNRCETNSHQVSNGDVRSSSRGRNSYPLKSIMKNSSSSQSPASVAQGSRNSHGEIFPLIKNRQPNTDAASVLRTPVDRNVAAAKNSDMTPHKSTSPPSQQQRADVKVVERPGSQNRNRCHNLTACESAMDTAKHSTPPTPKLQLKETLPENVFTQVKIQWVETDEECWVTLSANNNLLEKIALTLYEAKSPVYVSPCIGMICGAMYEELWCRAVVLQTEPKLVVRFIDYGNREEVDQIVLIDKSLVAIPAQAIHIRLANGSSCKAAMDKTIEVKPVCVENDIVIVHLPGGMYPKDSSVPVVRKPDILRDMQPAGAILKLPVRPQTMERVSPIKQAVRRESGKLVADEKGSDNHVERLNGKTQISSNRSCVIELLKIAQKGTFEFKTIIDSNSCIGVCMTSDFYEEYGKIDSIWESYSAENAENNFRPSIGDFICVEYDDGWQRGYVLKALEQRKWRVALVDVGIITDVQNIVPLLKEHQELCEFACLCSMGKLHIETSEFQNMYKLKKTFGIEVIDVDKNTSEVKCILKDRKNRSNICDIILKRWIPKELLSQPEVTVPVIQLRYPIYKFESGSCVMIEHIEKQGHMFVKWKDTKNIRNTVAKLLADAANNLVCLKTRPEISQCVVAKFTEDQQWYRALIKSLSPDKRTAQVLYVDYGNAENVAVTDLRQVPQALFSAPRALIEIYLSGLPNTELTTPQRVFLMKWITSAHKLKMHFTTSIEDGVVLKCSDGTVFNQTLIRLGKSNELDSQTLLEVPNKSTLPKRHPGTESDDSGSSSAPLDTPKQPALHVMSINSEQNGDLLEDKQKMNSVSPRNVEEMDARISKLSQIDSVEVEPAQVGKDMPVIIPIVDLQLGENNLIFQCIMDPESRIIACYKCDLAVIEEVTLKMTMEISQYIETIDSTPYLPTEETTVLAKFEDMWYRALYLGTQNNDCIVMFIDFGNSEVIPLSDIRRIPPQFVMLPALAIVCTVKDVPEKVSSLEFTQFFEEDHTYKAVVVAKDEDCQYIVEFPHVKALLKI